MVTGNYHCCLKSVSVKNCKVMVIQIKRAQINMHVHDVKCTVIFPSQKSGQESAFHWLYIKKKLTITKLFILIMARYFYIIHAKIFY